MELDTSRSIKVGIFVIAGVACLIAAIYFIGSHSNLFGTNIYVSAVFKDISGLQRGNNVRYAGITVGAVKDIQIINDTSVVVIMSIEERMQPFIKEDAVATIGTDGLMGSKLVDISAGSPDAMAVRDGDRIRSREPVEIEKMIRVLGSTNERVDEITKDVKDITGAISSGNGILGRLLHDTAAADKLDAVLANLEETTAQAAKTSGNLAEVTSQVRRGEGALGKLISDTAYERRISSSLKNFESASQEAKQATNNLSEVTEKLADEKGTIGLLTSDSSAAKLDRTLNNVEEGTKKFSENMEALQHNFLFRRYFKKKKKRESD